MGTRVGVAESWVLGPQGAQPDEPQELGELMRTICNDARLTSNMFGQPDGGNGRPHNEN